MISVTLTAVEDGSIFPDRNLPFLQSRFWGEFKAKSGWLPLHFTACWSYSANPPVALPLLVLLRPLAPVTKLAPGIKLAYIPWGPELPADFPPDARAAALLALARALRPRLPRSTLFVRFDPSWFSTSFLPSLKVPPLVPAGANVQPADTVLVDITAPAESLLARMKPKTRYNIRLAQKKVSVLRPDALGLDDFYALLEETAARDGIAIHNKTYYHNLFHGTDKGQSVRLYLAHHEEKAIAAVIILYYGQTATYLYGASANEKRNLMAPYLLQWQAMLDAKEAGCTAYDLFGIPPDDNPAHPMAGLYRFKTGFGGEIIHRQGSWDFPYIAPLYHLFRFAETVRKTLRDRKKHGGGKSRAPAETA